MSLFLADYILLNIHIYDDSMIKNTEDSKLIKMWSVWSWRDDEAWVNYNKKDANYNEDWDFWRNSYTDLTHISHRRKIRLQEGFNIYWSI